MKHSTPADGMVRSLMICLVVQMAIAAYIAWTKPPQVYLIPRTLATTADEELRTAEHHARFVAWCEMIAGMTGASLFFPYLALANRTARTLGAGDMKATPGWMIASFLVPVLNLWKPWIALEELWKATTPARGDWKRASGSWLVHVWFLHHILDGGVGQAVWLWRRWYPEAATMGLINQDITHMLVAAQMLHIGKSCLTMMLASQLQRRLRARFTLYHPADAALAIVNPPAVDATPTTPVEIACSAT